MPTASSCVTASASRIVTGKLSQNGTPPELPSDATTVAMEAARDNVELSELKVTVESETDFRGVLGVDGSAHPGPLAVRVRIELAAPDATEDQLREIVERAEAHSPVRDAISREVSMSTEVVTS